MIYDGQFGGNILVVGKTDCGKTYFVQKLSLNNFFGKLKKTEWVSGIELSESKEAEIQSCFNHNIKFHSATDTEELKTLIETFKLRAHDLVEKEENVNNSIYREKKIMERLIIMDDVSGIANSCREFAEYLTVSQKYRYHCVYVFHIIIPEKEIWKKYLSQTNISIFFLPASHIKWFRKLFRVIVCRQQLNTFRCTQCG